MNIRTPHLFSAFSMVLLFGCGDNTLQSSIPTYTVSEQAFTVAIPVEGEIEASKAEVISAPGQRPMTIAWLEDEYTQVSAGQVVAQFDGEQLGLDLRKEELELLLLQQDLHLKQLSREQDELDVKEDKALVSKEFQFADTYAIDDVRLYSRLEIIEKMQNKDYLSAKDDYLDWKKDSVTDQSDSAISVLNIKKKGSEAKYEQINSALNALEVRAPYDGMLVYEKNWRGEKPAVGQVIFPGNAIAKIPNLHEMKVSGYVLDKNAVGIAPGMTADITLDAFPDKHFTGKVLTMAAFSRTIRRGDPTKYFEVTLSLDDSDTTYFSPGRKASAIIAGSLGKQALLVPTQAIYNEDGQNFVYVQSGLSFNKTAITVNKRNLNFVEITDGLEAGDRVALSYTELL